MKRLILSILAFGAVATIAGCSSSSSSSSSASSGSASVRSSTFCVGNIRIDKASANVSSIDGFVTVLKANKSALDDMANNLPSGKVGTEARQTVDAAREAISTGNTTAIQNLPSTYGGDIDSYCGVDGAGNPLPAYYATGKETTFCKNFLPVYEAASNATSEAGTLASLEANKAQVAMLATEVSSLPSSIRDKAQQTVTSAQTAINENSTAALQQNGDANDVALYCGQNQ